MPTDTVYGVAADAFDPAGVRRLLRAKGRGRAMPTPVLIGSLDTLRALATNLTPEARELAAEFWPGGLTLDLPPAAEPALGSRRQPVHRGAADARPRGRASTCSLTTVRSRSAART